MSTGWGNVFLPPKEPNPIREGKDAARERLKRKAEAAKTEEQRIGDMARAQRKRERACFWTWPWGHVYEFLTSSAGICGGCSKTAWPRNR